MYSQTSLMLLNTKNTVAHIFEHLIAVIPEFGLRLFQNPAGNDLKKTAGAD
jgi:miniconductance mechanosensitive channel